MDLNCFARYSHLYRQLRAGCQPAAVLRANHRGYLALPGGQSLPNHRCRQLFRSAKPEIVSINHNRMSPELYLFRHFSFFDSHIQCLISDLKKFSARRCSRHSPGDNICCKVHTSSVSSRRRIFPLTNVLESKQEMDLTVFHGENKQGKEVAE